MTHIVSITSKGQATIPKELREKFGMKDKAIVVETDEGILLKPLPTPSQEKGSLRHLLVDKTARELVQESRHRDAEREKKLRGEAR